MYSKKDENKIRNLERENFHKLKNEENKNRNIPLSDDILYISDFNLKKFLILEIVVIYIQLLINIIILILENFPIKLFQNLLKEIQIEIDCFIKKFGNEYFETFKLFEKITEKDIKEW